MTDSFFRGLGLGLTILLVNILLPFIGRILGKPLRKLGYKELTEEEIKRIESTVFPRWFDYLHPSLVIFSVVLWIGLFLVGFFTFPLLQEFIFKTPGTIFFKGMNPSYAITILFFIMILVVGIFIDILPSFFPKFELYMYQGVFRKGLKEGMFRLTATREVYYKMLRWASIVFVPILFLHLHNFTRITDKELVLNPLLSLSDQKYFWNQVESLGLHGFDTFNLSPYLDITLDNKKKINLLSKGFPYPGKDEIIKLLKKVKEKNIPVAVIRPNDKDVRFPSGEHQQEARQHVFDIFDSAEKALAQ